MNGTKRDAFDTVNPIVAFIFFAFALVVPMLLMHPVLLGASLLSGVVWLFILRGRSALPLLLKFVLPVMLLSALLNPVFNHAGLTILFYLRHNPVTLESILYGCASSAMLGSVIIWFSCFNRIFTSDKLLYLLGRLVPSLSLIFSMALRFVPLFSEQGKRIATAQQGVGLRASGGLLARAKNGLRIISSLITWALESSVTSADSMHARGYGLHPRSSFAIYRFDGRDALVGTLIALGMLILGLGAYFGAVSVRFFPSYRMNEPSPLFFLVAAAYTLTLFIPVIMNAKEAVKWHLLKSRI